MRTQYAVIACAILIVGVSSYCILFALTVPLQAETRILYYFLSLVILPFLSICGIVCSSRLLERSVWRTFASGLGVISVGTAALALLQWIIIDLAVKTNRIVVHEPWKAVAAGFVIATIIYVLAMQIISVRKVKKTSHAMLLFSSLCLIVSASHAFQFVPKFLQKGEEASSLAYFPAEDLISTRAPSFSLPTIHKETYVFERDRGKVVLLNFWAT